MEQNKVVYCNTKRFDGDDSVRTKLTLDFSNVTEADLIEYAVDALVIKWQNSIRRKKESKVPAEATYIVPKPGTRAVAASTPFDALCTITTGMVGGDAAKGKQLALDFINKSGSVEAALLTFQNLIEDTVDAT